MSYIFTKTGDVSTTERQSSTSSEPTNEVKPYTFSKPSIKFNGDGGINEEVISEDTEEKFYKKAFKTDRL